ncbi:phasin family protein [Massilia atriviolacea]|uniref:Phasin family protein n=1 Tax=Massilia atriviolacea TaxID=2495579 RepID=A0A430HIV4_9BURK|nr:phasin family protein [Massilia atriviolacea]RSZ57457.1 phasin family protein [Massilia atriviolacea]
MPSYPNRPPMRSPFDTQVDFLTGVASTGLDALRRLSALNLQLARQLNDDGIDALRALMAFGARAAGAAPGAPASHRPA